MIWHLSFSWFLESISEPWEFKYFFNTKLRGYNSFAKMKRYLVISAIYLWVIDFLVLLQTFCSATDESGLWDYSVWRKRRWTEGCANDGSPGKMDGEWTETLSHSLCLGGQETHGFSGHRYNSTRLDVQERQFVCPTLIWIHTAGKEIQKSKIIWKKIHSSD